MRNLLSLMIALFLVVMTLSVWPTPEAKGQGVAPVAKADGEQKWERTLAEARKEGTVVIASTMAVATRSALMRELKKYGIDAEFMATTGNELEKRALSENRAGINSIDLVLHGSTNMFSLKKAGLPFEPVASVLALPEVTDPKNWRNGKLWYLDRDGKYFLAFAGIPSGIITYNAQMVKPGEINTWRDLLAPKWKGRILMGDPTISGTSQAVLQGVGLRVLGIDYLRALAKQEPILSRDERLLAEWVARGKYPIVVGINQPVVTDLMAAGAPMANMRPEGSGLITTHPANVALLKKAPHPNAAKVLINVLLTKEVQYKYSKDQRYQSLRVDVPTDHLSKDRLLPDANVVLTTDELFYEGRAEATRVFKELFGPLSK